MKTLHLSIIAICLIGLLFIPSYLKSIQADNTNGVEIQNIQVKPSTIKVGDTFTVTATLVNNSTVPIVLDTGKCSIEDTQVSFFTVMFDNHAKIKTKNINCAGVGRSQILNPGKNIIGTSPDYTLEYIATESGTANVTVTFPYYVKNQTDPTQPNIEQTISKSLLFTIYDNNTGTMTITETVSSPLEQFKSGTAAKDVKCKEGLQLVIKTEDSSPACVKPETATNLIQSGWATVITNPSDNSITKTPYNGIDKPSGIILLGNQTYYMTTFNGTLDSIPSSGTDISFHGVLFTLLRPLSSNANGNLYVVNVKFTSDNTNESLVIYPVGVGAVQADKVLSKHTHPQVGFIVYQENTIKLLVSTDNQASSALKLYLSTDSDIIQPGKPIGITISVNNTLATLVDISAQNNWSYSNVSTGPCDTIGYGISVLDGFYEKNNVTQGKILNLFNPGILCPAIQETAKVYEFQPNSGDVKQVQCKPIKGLQCETGSYQMGQNYKFNGYWDSGIVQPFKSGIYTLVGADEWGNIAIEHFVVTNSTIFAGDLGSMSCPAMFGGVQFGATIKNSTGFANYYNSTQDGHMFFFLHPKMQGTISVQYTSPANAAWFQNNGNAPFNMTNGAALFYMANVTNGKMITSYAVSLYNDETGHHSQICHYGIPYGGFAEPCNTDNTGDIPPSELYDASKLLHPGINTLFEPNSVMLYPNSNPVFTATVSANSDAMPGTYWLSLERSLCGPGVLAKLVVLP